MKKIKEKNPFLTPNCPIDFKLCMIIPVVVWYDLVSVTTLFYSSDSYHNKVTIIREASLYSSPKNVSMSFNSILYLRSFQQIYV